MAGLLFGNDYSIIKSSIERVMTTFDNPIFVEIGVHKGDTSRALIEEIKKFNKDYYYYGIDPGVDNPRVSGMMFLQIFSDDAIDIIGTMHWVFVDGCHCSLCVERDLKLYSEKLVKGGEILFHDAAPGTQGRDSQDYIFMRDRHNIEIAKQGIGVRKVLDRSWPQLELIHKSEEKDYGGVEVLRKL